MNSYVQALAWAIDDGRALHFDLLGRGAHFFRTLLVQTRSEPVLLVQDLMWNTIITGWQDRHRQHDVVEFASFINDKHKLPLVEGTWEARTFLHGEGLIKDTGHSAQPLLLHMISAPPGLAPICQVQSLVDSWHAQEDVHAFTVLPPVLMLQLGRFHNADGRINKLHTHVEVDEELWIPLFNGAGIQDTTKCYYALSGDSGAATTIDRRFRAVKHRT
ncbi:PRP2 [Symbiodinium sp. CCMP2456]|nr:PRP2 [Symbiodinium sp. CCMP2456]